MFNRHAKYLVLLSIVYWTSGAAQFVHESTEHACRDHTVARLVRLAKTAAPKNRPAKPADDAPDDDDCMTCQMLAHMSAHQPLALPTISVPLPSTVVLHIAAQRCESVHLLSSPPIRGPPTAA